MEAERMPLRTRLAALHGDADQAAEQLDRMARSFHLEMERLLATEAPAPARRSLRLGFGRPGLHAAPGVMGAPATSA